MSLTNPNTGWNRDRQALQHLIVLYVKPITLFKHNTTFSKDHTIAAMAGFEYYEAANKGVAASGSLAPTDDFEDLALTLNNATTQTRGTDSYHSTERIISGFGRLNYDWKDKYLASFTVRRDGYSRLIGDNQFGTFPAVSMGWMVHKERFMSSTANWLSYLKLRKLGKNGNIGIGTNNGIGI